MQSIHSTQEAEALLQILTSSGHSALVQLAAEVPLYGTLNGTATLDGIATMDAALIAVSARIGSVSICSESMEDGGAVKKVKDF